MTETKRGGGEADERQRTGAGGDEVESAGDTTAAATVGDDAPDHHKPVGADTRVKVAGDPKD